ncbi:MAG: tetratricopeptide repeat protein [Bacteroidaceae bacterium]|nr:tetratricopeptide repeat protein [Bacteroidaceae bacterium]
MAKKAVNPAPKQDPKGLEEALSKSEQFFENNKKTIFGCLIAIIVIIAGGMLYSAKVAQPRQLKAAEAIFPGETYFVNGDYSTALNGDAYGFEGFESLSKQYKSTKAGKLAGLYAGLCYAQLDSMEVAEKYLAKFSGRDQMVSPSALGALANCYANAGQYTKAISTFEKAAKKADNNLLSPYFYFQAGLIYESIDKPAQALKTYKMIKAKYPESIESQDIDKYIARLTNK